jgi:hypothetical protein
MHPPRSTLDGIRFPTTPSQPHTLNRPSARAGTHRRVCPGCLQRVWCACSLGSVRAGFPTRWAAAAVLGRPGRWREEQQQRRNSGTTHLYPNARTRVSRIFIHSTPTPPFPSAFEHHSRYSVSPFWGGFFLLRLLLGAFPSRTFPFAASPWDSFCVCSCVMKRDREELKLLLLD